MIGFFVVVFYLFARYLYGFGIKHNAPYDVVYVVHNGKEELLWDDLQATREHHWFLLLCLFYKKAQMPTRQCLTKTYYTYHSGKGVVFNLYRYTDDYELNNVELIKSFNLSDVCDYSVMMNAWDARPQTHFPEFFDSETKEPVKTYVEPPTALSMQDKTERLLDSTKYLSWKRRKIVGADGTIDPKFYE